MDDPTIDAAMRAELAERQSVAAVMAEYLPDAPAWRVDWLLSTIGREHGAVVPVSPAERAVVAKMIKDARRLDASLAAVPAAMLPPELAADLRSTMHRATLVAGVRASTRTPRGRRNWRAVTLVAVCRALWTRYRGEALPTWLNEAHPLIGLIGAMMEAVGECGDPRSAADSWAEAPDNPALFFEIDD